MRGRLSWGGVVIENEDLDLENFKSLNAISQFVGKKLTLA